MQSADLDKFVLESGYTPEELAGFKEMAAAFPKETIEPSAPFMGNEGLGDTNIPASTPIGSRSLGQQGTIMPFQAPMTQAFGARSGIERYSGGVNLGTDFALPKGSKLSAPPGNWEVVGAVSGGREGDRGFNSGSGNLVKLRNIDTGETIAFEHLGEVGVIPGQKISGGTVVGTVGLSGNTSGAHASLPYKNAQGQYQDIRQSPYAKYLWK